MTDREITCTELLQRIEGLEYTVMLLEKLYNNASKQIELLEGKERTGGQMNNNCENNELSIEQEADMILRKIMDTCRAHNYCKYCPYSDTNGTCKISSGTPENWEI